MTVAKIKVDFIIAFIFNNFVLSFSYNGLIIATCNIAKLFKYILYIY